MQKSHKKTNKHFQTDKKLTMIAEKMRKLAAISTEKHLEAKQAQMLNVDSLIVLRM